MIENPKSARDTNVTSNEKVPKITRDTNNNSMKKNA